MISTSLLLAIVRPGHSCKIGGREDRCMMHDEVRMLQLPRFGGKMLTKQNVVSVVGGTDDRRAVGFSGMIEGIGNRSATLH